jgi:large subunit ribosomal protein L9
MKVILKEDVKNLGAMGAVVNVTPGYARNYLLPRGLAAEANVKNVRALEHEKRVIQEKGRKLKEAALSLSERIAAASVTLRAKAGEEEKLFGSVTAKDIAEALAAQGIEMDRKKIALEEPIKRLGSYEVKVKLGHEVTAALRVEVLPE